MSSKPKPQVSATSVTPNGVLLYSGLRIENTTLEQCQIALRMVSSGMLDLELGHDTGFRVQANEAYGNDPKIWTYLFFFRELLKKYVDHEENRTPASVAANAINHFAAFLDTIEPITTPGIPKRVELLRNLQSDSFISR